MEIAPQIILGVCNPASAYAALQAEASIGVLLPCNVVVRAVEAGTTIVETIDPRTMHEFTGNDSIQPVAERVRGMLLVALDSLGD